MKTCTAEERLALTVEELEAVESTLQPGLGEMAPEALEELAAALEEMLGSAIALHDGEGQAARSPFSQPERLPKKLELLSAALDRVNTALADVREIETRNESPSQSEIARRAAQLKAAAGGPEPHPADDCEADPGIRAIPNENRPPSGAFDAEGFRPGFERSHKPR